LDVQEKERGNGGTVPDMAVITKPILHAAFHLDQ